MFMYHLKTEQIFFQSRLTTTNVIVMVRPGTHNVVFKSRFKGTLFLKISVVMLCSLLKMTKSCILVRNDHASHSRFISS